MAGTMFGKVWHHTFCDNRMEVLAGWSDEGVRGLYMEEDVGIVTLFESYQKWRGYPLQSTGSACNFKTLDKKNSQSVKHVLQRGPWACVLFPVSSCVVNLPRKEHHSRTFGIFDYGSTSDVAPCDFDGETLLVIDRAQSARQPTIRIVQLERNELKELSDVPKVGRATLIRLWGDSFIVYAVCSDIFVYSYAQEQMRHTLHGHRADVVAMDASGPNLVVTLSVDSIVALWDGHTGECARSFIVPEANFYMGYPYCLSMRGQRIAVSADEGVFLLEFDEEPAKDKRLDV